MNANVDLGLCHAQKYQDLSDLELYAVRSTIKKVIRRSEAAFVASQGDYERELRDIQATLIERVLFSNLPNDGPPTPLFRQELAELIAERGMRLDRVLEIFCAATHSRAKTIEDLTEIEAMVVWHFVRGVRRKNDDPRGGRGHDQG